jgi:hypothetical protein
MENIAPPAAPPLVDNPTALEIFADEATGFFLHNGNLSITLSSARADHSSDPAPVSRVVVGRIVLPVNGALALALGLYDFLKRMGIDPAQPMPGQSAH